jgi:hypothetical protein
VIGQSQQEKESRYTSTFSWLHLVKCLEVISSWHGHRNDFITAKRLCKRIQLPGTNNSTALGACRVLEVKWHTSSRRRTVTVVARGLPEYDCVVCCHHRHEDEIWSSPLAAWDAEKITGQQPFQQITSYARSRAFAGPLPVLRCR